MIVLGIIIGWFGGCCAVAIFFGLAQAPMQTCPRCAEGGLEWCTLRVRDDEVTCDVCYMCDGTGQVRL